LIRFVARDDLVELVDILEIGYRIVRQQLHSRENNPVRRRQPWQNVRRHDERWMIRPLRRITAKTSTTRQRDSQKALFHLIAVQCVFKNALNFAAAQRRPYFQDIAAVLKPRDMIAPKK